jgi:hypothetical protein
MLTFNVDADGVILKVDLNDTDFNNIDPDLRTSFA